MTVPFGNARPSAATRRGSVGLARGSCTSRVRPRRRTCRSRSCRRTRARAVDDHVVALAGRERREIGVLDERVALEPQHAAVEHRHDEHAAVGEPAEARTAAAAPRRSSRPCRSGPSRRRGRSCWSLKNSRPSCQRGPSGNARPSSTMVVVRSRHGRGPYSSGGRASVGLTSSSSCARDSGSSGTRTIAANSEPMPQSAIARPISPCGCGEHAGEHEARATDPSTPITPSRPFDVLRVSVGNSSTPSVPSAMPPALAAMIDVRRHEPQQRAAAEEEDHLRRGRDGERDRGDRAPAADLGQPAAEHEPERARGCRWSPCGTARCRCSRSGARR